MKKEFSTAWKASKQPRKQRKFRANAPLHLKRKMLAVNLSKDLKKKQGKRNVVVRKGDKVKIMRGKFKGKQGKILDVFTKQGRVTVEGIQVQKREGSKVPVKLQPSNLQITEMVERGKGKSKVEKKEAKKETKTDKKENSKKEEKPVKKESKTKTEKKK